MSTPNVHLYINYSNKTYESVEVFGPGDASKKFATGDPVADFARADVFARLRADKAGVAYLCSSSVNDFVFDVPGYRFNEHDMLEAAE